MDLQRDSVHHRNQGDIGPDVRTKMEKRLDELLARPPVYTKTDGSDTELDKLKVSGCFRTEVGVQNYSTVASVMQTAVKNGQNPFEVLRAIATLALA